MNKIGCNVENCSHNKSNVCYADRINVGGHGSKSPGDTCCGSFLDKAHYSNLTNNTSSKGACDAIVCEVETCTYNTNKLCKANSIQVSGNRVNVYTETECSTFKLR